MNRLAIDAQREQEAAWENDRLAHHLLGLIVAELDSDPQSLKCFDSRVVETARLCVSRRKDFIKRNPWMGEVK